MDNFEFIMKSIKELKTKTKNTLTPKIINFLNINN